MMGKWCCVFAYDATNALLTFAPRIELMVLNSGNNSQNKWANDAISLSLVAMQFRDSLNYFSALCIPGICYNWQSLL